ncbi:MAG TPA: shufflon system plasmid conjugative transfer pilus tip adhesin PilV [Buttiauxella sp.]|jgi:hypothetical protein
MKTKKIHRGILSIEVAIALVVVMFACIYGLNRYSQYVDELEWTVQARHMDAISAAAKSYIRDNRDSLVGQVSGGGTVKLTGTQLQQAGYLPDGFSLRNSASQSFEVAVTRNPKASQKLMAFVFTRGGTAIPYKGMRYISQTMKGSGGYIPTANQAEGATWKFNLGSYGLTGEAGRLTSYLSSDILGTDDQESDRLYRYAITSRPELNRMHAAIDMNGNNLNNTGTVNAQTGNFSGNVNARDGGFTGNITGQNGSFSGSVSAPTVTTNDLNAQTTRTAGETYTGGWYRTTGDAGWYSEKHNGGLYMSDSQWIRSYNDKGIYTGGQVQAGSILSNGPIVASGTLQANGRATMGEFIKINGQGTAGAWCPENGLVAVDTTGGILSCQNNAWAKPQSGKPGYYCRYTSMSARKSEDYIGENPRTDRNCPVIYPGQVQGECSCIKIFMNY